LLLFVAQRFPKVELAPLSDPFALVQLQEFNIYLCSTVLVAHAHARRGARRADAAIEAMKRKVPTMMTECFELIERELLKGPWVMGEQYNDLRPVPVHDRDLDRRRRGRHDQAATRHREPQTHADAPSGAKSRATEGPKSPRLGGFTPFSHQTHGGCLVRKEQQPPPRSRRDGRRAWPCR
jgi:hypothetical protein